MEEAVNWESCRPKKLSKFTRPAVTLGKLLKLSKLQFPHFYNGDDDNNRTYLIGLFLGWCNRYKAIRRASDT